MNINKNVLFHEECLQIKTEIEEAMRVIQARHPNVSVYPQEMNSKLGSSITTFFPTNTNATAKDLLSSAYVAVDIKVCKR